MACLLASAASAAPSDSAKCRAIADPAKRLACYDRTAEQDAAPAEGEQTRAAPVMPSAAPRPSPAPSQARAPEPTRDERKVLTSGRIAATRPLRHGGQHRSIHVGVEHRRMNVALAAHRLGVAEPLGYRLDCPDDVAFGLRLGIEPLEIV